VPNRVGDFATRPSGFTHPNLVTEAGLKALELQLHQAREACETAQKTEDVNERRRQMHPVA